MSVQFRDRQIIDQEHQRQSKTAMLIRELRAGGKRLPRRHEAVLSRLTRPRQ